MKQKRRSLKTLATIAVLALISSSAAAMAAPTISPTQGSAEGGNTVTIADASYNFVEVSSGATSSVALDEDGVAYTWGRNDFNQLGVPDFTNIDSGIPLRVQMPTDTTFVSASAGTFHNVALDTNGDIYVWGGGVYGALGLGNELNALAPTKVTGEPGTTFPKFQKVSAGDAITVALDVNGKIWVWGLNQNGQLGLGDLVPEDQLVVSYPMQLPTPSEIVFEEVSAGVSNGAALTNDGDVWSWGMSVDGSLGQGDPENHDGTPPAQIQFPAGVKIDYLTLDYWSGAVIDTDGNLWTWGQNTFMQLGNGQTTNETSPILITLPEGLTFTEVALGSNHMAGLTAEGNVYVWGLVRIGDGSGMAPHPIPTQLIVPEGLTFSQLSAGYGFSSYLATDGQIYTIGSNIGGTLGIGDSTSAPEGLVLGPNFGNPQVSIDGTVVESQFADDSLTFTMPAGTPGEVQVTVQSTLAGGTVVSSPEIISTENLAYSYIGQFTGNITLTGNAVVGGSFSAVPHDFPADTNYTYQWFFADDAAGTGATPIDSQTGNTLVLSSDLLDKFVSVKVVANKDFYNEATFDSPFSGAIALPDFEDPGTVTLTGTTEAFSTVEAEPQTWPAGTTFTYEWYLADDASGTNEVLIPDAEEETFTIPASAVGKFIAAKITGHDGLATSEEVSTGYVGPILALEFSGGAVTVQGTPEAGQTLTAAPTGWPEGTHFTYEWLVYDEGSDVGTPAGSGETFVPTVDMDGKKVSVQVTATLPGYTTQTVDSDEVGPVDLPDVTAGSVLVSGPGQVGTQLNAHVAGWAPDGVALTYQWYVSSNMAGTDRQPIADSTLSAYIVQAADLDKFISVEVTGTLAGHDPQSAMSDAVGPMVLQPLTPGQVLLSGTPTAGSSVSALTPLWPLGTTLTYQWFSSDNADGSNPVEIVGQTGATFNVPSDLSGKFISVTVTGSMENHQPATASSTFAKVEAAPMPGTVTIGGETSVNGIAEAVLKDFPAGTTHTYQWQISDNADGSGATDLDGETEEFVVIPEAAIGKYLVVKVTSTNADFPERITTTISSTPITKQELRVVRYSGSDRYKTSLEVLKAGFEPGDVLFVATGENYADALSAGPAAAVSDARIVLTRKNSVDPGLISFLKETNPSKIYLIGGTQALSQSVANAFESVDPDVKNVERVYGSNRYETSAAVYKSFFNDQQVDSAYIATGENFADAVSASSVAGAQKVPVLLVQGTNGTNLVPAATKQLQAQNVEDLVIVGGQVAVSKTIQTNLSKSFNVERVGGKDRYATNVDLNSRLTNVSETSPETLYLATGQNFPDSLLAAPAAANLQSRLVLSNGTCIPSPVVSSWINGENSQVANVFLVGGLKALAASVENLQQCK